MPLSNRLVTRISIVPTTVRDAICGYSLGDARDKLAEIWGYTDFRRAQRRAVLGALQGRDVLAVLPTRRW